MKNEIRILILACALVLAGFANAQAPEVSYDGLVKQEKGRFKLTYVDPDIDFTAYN